MAEKTLVKPRSKVKPQAERHVGLDGPVTQQRFLEDAGEPPADGQRLLSAPRHRGPPETNCSGRRPLQQPQDAQQSGLSGAVRTDESQNLSVGHLDRGHDEGGRITVGNTEVAPL